MKIDDVVAQGTIKAFRIATVDGNAVGYEAHVHHETGHTEWLNVGDLTLAGAAPAPKGKKVDEEEEAPQSHGSRRSGR